MALCISWWKDLAELFQAVAVTGGVVLGGIWTYRLFVRNRLAYPRANVDLSMLHLPALTEKSRLVHVAVSIRNTGDVLLRSCHAELRLRNVVPTPKHLLEGTDDNRDPVPQGHTEIEWPALAIRKWDWDKHGFEVEPGESDCLHADFVIPRSISVIQLYCFIANSEKKDDGLVWPCTKFYCLKDGMEVKEMTEERQSVKAPLDEQQRQQKAQTGQQQQQVKSTDQSGKKK